MSSGREPIERDSFTCLHVHPRLRAASKYLSVYQYITQYGYYSAWLSPIHKTIPVCPPHKTGQYEVIAQNYSKTLKLKVPCICCFHYGLVYSIHQQNYENELINTSTNTNIYIFFFRRKRGKWWVFAPSFQGDLMPISTFWPMLFQASFERIKCSLFNGWCQGIN